MPWLLNEDAAIKSKFSGLTVSGGNAPPLGQPVAVRFRLPQSEMANATFPMVVIDHATISKADDREHRGPTALSYVPEGTTPGPIVVRDRATGQNVTWDTSADFDPNLSPFRVTDYPIPYNLDYQVTVYTRTQNHLMSLITSLAAIDRIPPRFGYLEIPEDGTVRTLDLLGGPEIEPSNDQDSKRIFRAVYSIRVVSELNLYEVQNGTPVVETVDVAISKI